MFSTMRRVLTLAAASVLFGCVTDDNGRASHDEGVRNGAVERTEPALGGGSLVSTDLVGVGDVSGLALSPDGGRIAYAVRRADPRTNSYDISWFVAPTVANARPILIESGGDAALYVSPEGGMNGELDASLARWSPDGDWIAFLRAENGEVQLWRARVDGSGSEQLTHNTANVDDFEWSVDGMLLYFSVGRARNVTRSEDERDGRDGFLLSDPLPPVVRNGHPLWPECVAQRVDSPLVADSSRRCVRALWVYDIEAVRERPMTASEVAAREHMTGDVKTAAEARVDRILGGIGSAYGIPSPGGERAAWFENPDPERYPGSSAPKRLVVGDPRDEGGRRSCLADVCTGFGLQEVWWDSNGDAVTFLSNDGPARATQSLYRWHLDSDGIDTLMRSDDSRLRDCIQATDTLFCVRQGWTKPDHIVSVSLTDASTEVIADPNATFEQLGFTPIEKFIYDDGRGVETYGHLVFPANYEPGRRYPLVVVQYRSGGFLRGGVGDEQPIHVYAQNGMFVLSTNMPFNSLLFATSGGSELDTTALFWEDERTHRRGLNAILRALDQLEARGLIDSGRIGITGLSAGASIVEQALVYTDRFAVASAAYANASPFAYYSMHSEVVRNTLYRNLHPFSEAGLRFWRERSSGLNADSVNEPYLLQVADREYALTLQNYVDLRENGKPVELFIFPDEYHVKWQPAHRLAIYNRNIDWMNFWLRGVESGLTGDPEQYVRWRAMRENQCRLFGPGGSEYRDDIPLPWYCRPGALDAAARH